jgi:hypothetical protein
MALFFRNRNRTRDPRVPEPKRTPLGYEYILYSIFYILYAIFYIEIVFVATVLFCLNKLLENLRYFHVMFLSVVLRVKI